MGNSSDDFDALGSPEMLTALAGLGLIVKDMIRDKVRFSIAEYVHPDRLEEATERILDIVYPTNELLFGLE